jgi:tRNA A-37 threonylcarbamoyl transferase component Bud32
VTTLTELREPLREWLKDKSAREAALLSVGYQGSVYLFERNGKRWVVKRAGTGLFTSWLHRLMLHREAAVYARLSSVIGVPQSLGMLDDEWLILEYISGEPLRQARYELKDPDTFYTHLHQVITDIHAAGVVHGDLKRKENILVTAAELPCVLDFGTALQRDGALLDRVLFNTVARADFNAWIKVKYANDYTGISPLDSEWYRPSLFEMVLRGLRRFWRVISFRQFRKQRRAQRARKAQQK